MCRAVAALAAPADCKTMMRILVLVVKLLVVAVKIEATMPNQADNNSDIRKFAELSASRERQKLSLSYGIW